MAYSIASRAEIAEFARNCMATATEAADTIQLSNRGARSASVLEAAMSAKQASASYDLPHFYGAKAWAAILSVDLRKSSARAVEVGPRKTYITMHTYLPTMAELVRRAEGRVIGLRGDGLFAGFGIEAYEGETCPVSKEAMGSAVQNAANCGKAMIEAVDEIIEPLLREKRINADRAGPVVVGIGVDIGEIVITRIGHSDASELTAYGPAVNKACKFCQGNGEVRTTFEAVKTFPTASDGKLKFINAGDYHRVEYPSDMRMLN